VSSRLQAVVLDVDGTLAETERDGHRVAYNRAFAELGLDYSWSVEEYGRLLVTAGGLPRLVAYLGRRGHSPSDALTLGHRLHARAVDHFRGWVAGGGATLRPGLAQLLDDLVSEGVRLGVATAGRRAWVLPFLKQVAPQVPFDAVVTYDDVTRLKPDPQAYLVALERLRVTPTRTVAVEDSRVGLLSAIGAGIPCVVVPAFYTAAEDFTGAAAVVARFEKLTVHLLGEIAATEGAGRTPPIACRPA
jgi:HAD superfamily hydrolase (TIGR01509 family)